MAEEKTPNKPKRKPIRAFFKYLFDIKKWLSYDELSANAQQTVGLYKRFFTAKVEGRKETYEEAVARLGLNEQQLLKRKRYFLFYAIFYLVMGIGLLVYFFYLLQHNSVTASLVSLTLAAVVFSYAYHESFWYMQMDKKKLGCTFKEWLVFTFLGIRQ